MPTTAEVRPSTGQIRTGQLPPPYTPQYLQARYEPEIDIKDILPNPFPDIIPVRPPENQDHLHPIQNLLIPNRGVVLGEALRSAIDVLDIPKITVLAWEQDRNTAAIQYALRLAEEAPERVQVILEEGDNSPLSIYRNTNLIIETAKKYGCDRVDLGWGFLAEDHEAIAQMEEAELFSVGPTSDQVEAWGNKTSALRKAEAAGVNVLPWAAGETITASENDILSWIAGGETPKEWETAKSKTEEIGFPLLVKSDVLGSGRGLIKVYNIDEFKDAWRFANLILKQHGTWHMTKLLEDAMHIEVQIMGDKYGNIVAISERNCSVQQHHQKRFEETAILTPEQIEYLEESATKIAAGYIGAGTVEFLMDKEGNFYFMELNTRMQVEHPVSETQTGIDIIATRYKIEEGYVLNPSEIKKRPGHVIEFRLCAKEGGLLINLGLDGDDIPKNARADISYGNGNTIPEGVKDGEEGNIDRLIDNLMALIIVSGYDRKSAINRMKTLLQSMKKHYRGPETNIDEGLTVLNDPRFVEGTMTTQESENLFKQIEEFLAAERAKVEEANQPVQPAAENVNPWTGRGPGGWEFAGKAGALTEGTFFRPRKNPRW